LSTGNCLQRSRDLLTTQDRVIPAQGVLVQEVRSSVAQIGRKILQTAVTYYGHHRSYNDRESQRLGCRCGLPGILYEA
jgi:hypothetical protein